MNGFSLTPEQYEQFQKLQEKEAKQKRYQRIQNFKQKLRADWAKLNDCPVTTEHAEYYADLPESEREATTVRDVLAALDKNEGTGEPDERETHDQEPDA